MKFLKDYHYISIISKQELVCSKRVDHKILIYNIVAVPTLIFLFSVLAFSVPLIVEKNKLHLYYFQTSTYN